jgi:hypothetical protein
MWNICEIIWTGKTKGSVVEVPFCPPQNSNGLARFRSWSSATRHRQLKLVIYIILTSYLTENISFFLLEISGGEDSAQK